MKNDTSFYGKQHVVFRATIGYLRMRDLGSVLHIRTNVRGVEALR